MTALRVLAVAMALSALAACGSSTTVVHNRLVPKSQEADDLQRAFDDGLLTQQEYDQQRRQLGL